MAAISLTTLRARVRERADMQQASFMLDTATSLDAFINEGVQILHEKMVMAYGSDYKEKTSSFTCDGTGNVTLPTDFFKLLGVDLNMYGVTRTIRPYMRAERNAHKNSSIWSPYSKPFYKLSGPTTLKLLPAPPSGLVGSIIYSPSVAPLASGSDTFETIDGWERYIVLYAAIQCLIKEESDTGALMEQLNIMNAQLDSVIENRDAGHPQHTVDVDLCEDPFWFYT